MLESCLPAVVPPSPTMRDRKDFRKLNMPSLKAVTSCVGDSLRAALRDKDGRKLGKGDRLVSLQLLP